MAINLRQIEVFRAVMLTGTISGAAEILFVSQPAVSRLLSHTEQTVGFTLFERIKGRLHATPEAQRLFQEVESAYVGVQRVNDVARSLAQDRAGCIRIVAHSTIGTELVPQAIGRFRRAHPEVRQSFECVRQHVLRERMLNQQAHLGVTLFPVEHSSLDAIPLCQARIVGVLPSAHPLARQQELHGADLRRHPLIGYEPGTPFGLLLEKIFEQTPLTEPFTIEAGTPGDACALAEAGAGIAIVDEFTARAYEGSNLAIRHIAGAPRLQASIVHRRYETISKAARAFIKVLHDQLTPAMAA